MSLHFYEVAVRRCHVHWIHQIIAFVEDIRSHRRHSKWKSMKLLELSGKGMFGYVNFVRIIMQESDKVFICLTM